MQPPERPALAAPLLFMLGGVSGACLTAVLVSAMRKPIESDLLFYQTVRNLVEDEYVGTVDRDELLANAINGAMEGLDPYSRFYTGADLDRVVHNTNGTFQGIGAVFAQPSDQGRVLFPVPDSPAERAGLRVGDQVLTFRGQALTDLAPGDFSRQLRALLPEPFELEVRHTDGLVETLQVTPGQVTDPTVRHITLLTPEIGYLALTTFSRRTVAEFDAAVEQLQEAGARELILDLRGNPGGLLNSATMIANRFIDSGALVVTKSRHGRSQASADPAEATLLGTPLVVLVDENSASASELLAGALQDDRRAALVGTATYGKGTIQTLTPLDGPDSMLKITTGFYSTPSGRSIDRHYRADGGSAIWPDIEVSLDDQERNALYLRLEDYTPPFALIAQVSALEAELGREPVLRVAPDPQLNAALALLEAAPL